MSAAIVSWLSSIATVLLDPAGEDASKVAAQLATLGDLRGANAAAIALDVVRVLAETAAVPRDADLFRIPAGAPAEDEPALTVLVAVGLAVASPRIAWRTRKAARAARSNLLAVAERAYTVAGEVGLDALSWLVDLIGTAARILSAIAADAAPVFEVRTGVSLPSTLVAWRLYGDPARAGDVIDTAGAATPLLMPVRFEAVGS